MHPLSLTPLQRDLADRPPTGSVFLSGPAGAGKTTAGIERLLSLMAQDVRADSILLLSPQRTLAWAYYEALQHPGVVGGGVMDILTMAGLAQRMVDLFWPMVAQAAGFTRPDDLPIFLNLETAQYYMSRVVRPMLEEGYFSAATLDINRLYSQVLDNLNKAAVVGFPYTEIGERLQSSWIGEPAQARLYADAQEAAIRFRNYCLAHNLLDFSLWMDVFCEHVWSQPFCRQHLNHTYHHLIYDNVEEDNPAAHDVVRQWLPEFDSALLIYDTEAGNRSFLGSDPYSGYALKELCQEQVEFTTSFVTTPDLRALASGLGEEILHRTDPGASRFLSPGLSSPEEEAGNPLAALQIGYHHFQPQMLDWVAEEIAILVQDEEIKPGEIAVLAPVMSDALRFSLSERLKRLGIPSRSHRPSRALREEPAVQCVLTLTALAHPDWGIRPEKFDLAYALMQSIAGLDLVRAKMLTEIVYRVREGQVNLGSFERIEPRIQERITIPFGEHYEELRNWLEDYQSGYPQELDHFLNRLFGEVLSQPGFGFHDDFIAGQQIANLIDSARNFRWAIAGNPPEYGTPPGKDYLEMVQDGVVAAQYLRSWQVQPEDSVLLAPAYTFLMLNRPVDVQFWIDAGGSRWFERLYQPLTHPYVLTRRWPVGAVWTDTDEYEADQAAMYRLALGLMRRCRRRIYLGLSALSEQGYEQQGPLLKALQRLLRDLDSGSLETDF